MKRTRTYVLLIVLTIMMVSSAVSKSDAHPASSVILQYDVEASILEVTAIHTVWNAEVHYISEITIELNGELVVSRDYSHQTSRSAQYDQFAIPAEEDDVFVVNTVCNEGGELEGVLIVGSTGTGSDLPVLPLALVGGLLFILTLGFMVEYRRKHG
jgi:hypothetical protein